MNKLGLASHYKKGFTIVELLVVIAVIAVLAAITIVGYGVWRKTTLQNVVKSDLRSLASAMENERNFKNAYPLSTPSTFTPSENVLISYDPASTAKAYCIDGKSTEDDSVVYYIESTAKDNGPQDGTCATRPIPPGVPSGLAVVTPKDGAIDLSWTAASAATSYNMQCALTSGFSGALTDTSSSTNGTVSGLAASTLYYCRINATNAYGTSAWTTPVSATTTTPIVPSGLAVTTTTQSSLALSWTATSGAQSYTVQCSLSAAFSSPITLSPSTNSATLSSMTANTLYYCRVRATTVYGTSAWSATITRTTLATMSAPTIAAVSRTQINYSWPAVSGATSYNIRYAPNSGFTSGVVVTNTTTASGSLTGLDQNATHYYQVQAVTPSGTGPYSSSSVAPSPGVPGSPVASAASSTQINVSWSAGSGAYAYLVQRATDAAFTANVVNTNNIAATSLAVTGLNSSTTYYFRVYSLGAPGTSSGWTTGTNAATYTNWGGYNLIATVGDWNLDGNNDVVGYQSATGATYLHLGGGNATLGPAIYLTNIGTIVRNLIGAPKPPSAVGPSLWWANTNGTGFSIPSNGGTGVTGGPIATGSNWTSYFSVFAAPRFYGASMSIIIGKTTELYYHTFTNGGATTFFVQYGSGWEQSFPGDRVFGAGDFTGDGNGDLIAIASNGYMYLYYGNGTGGTTSNPMIGTGWGNDKVMGGYDYNGDGKADILRYYATNNQLMIYPGTQVANFTGATSIIN